VSEYRALSTKGSSIIKQLFDLQWNIRSTKYFNF